MGWKIFAVADAILLAIFIVGTFAMGDFGGLGAFGQLAGVFGALIMAPLSALGLLAYAFNLTVLGAGFWTAFAYVNTVWVVGSCLYSVYTAVSNVADNWSIAGVIGTAIGFLIAAAYLYFAWLGVWRYARRRAQQPA